jgi:anti-sigma factor RsiW
VACEGWKTRLDAYLDGELPEAETREADAHVRACPECSQAALGQMQMNRAVQTAGRRFTPSADFRRRIEQQVAAKPRRRFSLAWAVLVAAVALLVAGALTTAYMRMLSTRRQVFSEIADLHVATMASTSPVDVVSTDRHTVKPWFQGKIPFSFNLPEVHDTEFTLVGGRMTYLEQTPGAQLIYDVRKHHISVFIFPATNLPSSLRGETELRSDLNFSLETWQQGGLRYFAIGDSSAADVAKLASLFQGK